MGKKRNGKLDALLQRGQWQEAEVLLERERAKDPENHWVITQLGVAFYEQQRYDEALELFLASLKIVPDCPLTLWNLAGALDALDNHAGALRIYTWLLQCNASPADDPCWESEEWTDALKADCVYRLGVCLQHLGKKRKAEHCYRQYLHLLSVGIDGAYSIEDVKRQLRGLHGAGNNGGAQSAMRQAVHSTLQATGAKSPKGRTPPPKLHELISGKRVASSSRK